MFVFFHGYSPDTWDKMLATGLVGDNDGIRFQQSLDLPEELKFNDLAKKDGKLYNIVKERNCPFYIDRLQGGCYIENYPYDKTLLDEYRDLLGDKFYGFQMHEWLSNYRSDANKKLAELSADEWTEENIKKVIFEKFPFKNLFLECMTLEEMAAAGKPLTAERFYDNMTAIYKKRQKIGELVPCDSAFLAYQFELQCGTKRIMPEVGAQTPDSRLQICYARGMTRREDKSFGIYYEPWGGEPFSACAYNGAKNEWNMGEGDFPFETYGSNGGSSRSLQKRIFLYAYLSGAEFISEEWGLYNTFLEGTDFELSPYGKVKRDFLSFVRKYNDIGDKLTPIAAVLPEELMVLDTCSKPYSLFEYESTSERLASVKNGVSELFATSVPMLGNKREIKALKNSDMPDAIDLLNRDDAMLKKYDYLVDLTFGSDLKDKFSNICEAKEVQSLLRKLLPVYVDGGLHWMINECKSGGYYLTVFNHSGIARSVAEGEYTLPEAEKTVTLSFKNEASPLLLEGDGRLSKEDSVYRVTVPAGGFAFIKF